jgi:hypothetical protein
MATSLMLAGCGSNKSSMATTSTSATTAPTSGIASHVLSSDELPPKFTGANPSVSKSISAWLTANQTPTQDVAPETKRLTRLGFLAGAHEDLTGPSAGGGVSIAEQFKTPSGARSELANEVKLIKANEGQYFKGFPVAGIPGAAGLAETGKPPGVNVAFAAGNHYYLVGAQLPATASSEAIVIAAAKRLYQRVGG